LLTITPEDVLRTAAELVDCAPMSREIGDDEAE